MAASLAGSVLDGLKSRIDIMLESALSFMISPLLKLLTTSSIYSMDSSSGFPSPWFDPGNSSIPRFPSSALDNSFCDESGCSSPSFLSSGIGVCWLSRVCSGATDLFAHSFPVSLIVLVHCMSFHPPPFDLFPGTVDTKSLSWSPLIRTV